jgi:restriction endonuclease S subunit
MIAGLTPPPKDDRKVFAVKYKALQGRFDPKTYLYRQHTTDKAFPCASLGSLTVTEPDYGSGSRAVERTSDDQPKYIRITDFRDDGISAGHEFLTAETIEPDCFLQDGDVLFARSGATAGKTFIYNVQDVGRAVFAGYCIRFRFDESRVLPLFIYYFTKTTAYRQWVATIQRPSGQPNINKPEFKSLELPIPPLDVQREVVARLNAERKKVEGLRAEAEGGWQTAKRWFEERLLLGGP